MREALRLAEAAETELARRSLHKCVKLLWPVVEPATEFKDNWHIGCICEHLEAVSLGQIKNFCLNLPPRHAKSLLVCVFWFCWEWINRPHVRWLYSSNAESLALRDAQKSRTIIDSDLFQARFGSAFSLLADDNSKIRFVNDHGGHRISTSVGGRGMGEGGDIICVDDAHKINVIDSDLARQQVFTWWDQVMGTRGNDPANTRRVIVMQRLSDLDLTGHVLSQKHGYECLVIPARYEPDRVVKHWLPGDTQDTIRDRHGMDAIIPTALQRSGKIIIDPRTEAGEVLWPNHFGETEVRNLERVLGPWGTAGQLQQRPSPEGGGLIKGDGFRHFDERVVPAEDGRLLKTLVLYDRDGKVVREVPFEHCRWFQTCDTAMCAGQENDYTVIMTMATTPTNELLIYDVFRDKVEVPYQFGKMIEQRLRHPYILFQAVENKQSGIGLIQAGLLKGIPIRKLKASGDKVQRAAPLADMYQSGLVYHRAAAPWLSTYEDEAIKFPNGRFDDQVDAAAYGALLATQDALLTACRSVDSMMVYPNAEEVRERTEPTFPDGVRPAGMAADRYAELYLGWDDDMPTTHDTPWGW